MIVFLCFRGGEPHAVTEDIVFWQQRTLQSQYSVLYLDALFWKIRRDTVASETIYVRSAGFYVGGQESSYGWLEVLQDLRQRGVHEVLLGVFDGLPELEEAFHQVDLKVDIQRCRCIKVRNTLYKVRKKDHTEISFDLKKIYRTSHVLKPKNSSPSVQSVEKIVYLIFY